MASAVADWEPLEPRTWGQKQVDVLRELAWWQWLFVILGTAFFFLINLTRDREHGNQIGYALAMIPLMAALFIRLVTTGRSMEPSPLLKKMLKDRSGFTVRLSVFVDEQIIGEDEGIVSFEDGSFVFTGAHTAFRLRPQDVFVPGDSFANGPLMQATTKQFLYGNRSRNSVWGFRLTANPQCRLYFFPLGTRPLSPYATGRGFYQATFAWLQRESQSEGVTVLPPQTPMPNYRPPRYFRRKNPAA